MVSDYVISSEGASDEPRSKKMKMAVDVTRNLQKEISQEHIGN